MKFYLLVLILTMTGTAFANPLDYLKNTIQKDGYILYQTPLTFSGTGTLVGGTPDAISIVSDPQTCFPDVMNGQSSNIRRVDSIDLGSISQTTSFDGTVGVDLLKFMNTANSIFKIGANVSGIQSVDLTFQGARIEYIDTIYLEEFYKNKMSDPCKKLLNSVGFVIQALRVDQMRFSFKNKSGAYINIAADGISQYFNIDMNVNYHIEQNYTLVIDTPKYIGYQLGRLQEEDKGLALYRAQKTFMNRYVFKSIAIFKEMLQLD